jgi:uncharacterized protein DUF4255/IPT/TIG domain-containing protein
VSNALAIAAVSAVLTDLLNNGLIDHDLTAVGNVQVSAVAPDLVTTGTNEGPRLNLFMYHASTNQGWRNVGLPSSSSSGERVSNPPLALDLHYLLTAYASKDFHAEILLGYAMQLLHECPVLARDAIRKTLKVAPPVTGAILPPTQQTLVAADLADQVELIKVVPQAPSTEELSRLWTALQAHYRPTAGYLASVVLIESRKSTKSGLPVRVSNLKVRPWKHPEVEAVDPQIVGSGDQLTLTGVNLKADSVGVDFGSGLVPPDSVTENQVKVTLPAGLHAGVLTLQVVQPLDLGTPKEPHSAVESNVMAFVLRPRITATAAAANSITVTVQPPLAAGQVLTVLLNALGGSGGAGFTFTADPASATIATVPVPITGVPSGDYLVRVQVDGAQSVLDVDPVSGRYKGTPKVTVP